MVKNIRVRSIEIRIKTKRRTTYRNSHVQMKKHTIQDRSTLLNTVPSISEDVDLPNKRYCSK